MSSTSPDILQGDLARATDATQQILDAFGLETYIFEVEPRDGVWQVTLECATDEGAWQALTITAPFDRLVACADDAKARLEFIKEWGDRLSKCKARRA